MTRKSIGLAIDTPNRNSDNSRMRTQEAVDHYGSQVALAEAIGVKQPTVAGWGEYPPLPRQIDIEVATAGKLKAELSDAARRVLAEPKAAA